MHSEKTMSFSRKKWILSVFSILLFSMNLIGCQQNNSTKNPSKPYLPEKAIKNGDIVNVHGKISNLEKFLQFVKNVNNGVKDKVRITSYTTEGDPIFDNLDFNGKNIKYTYDNSQDSFGRPEIKSDTCSEIGSTNTVNGVEYHLSKCSSNVGKTFIFSVPK
jgi:hypothetical protein